MPKKLQNTLTEYSFSKKDIIGIADEPEDEYDLLTVIMIRQGKEPEENGIFEYLNGIFDGDINRIQKYSHIEWSEPFQEEASKMTGFGDMIYERGIQQGMQQGRCLEVYSLVQDGILEPEVGAKRVSMSLDDFADAMQKAGYKLPEMV